MCRRIIAHHMHHDVAAPMIMDPISDYPTIYANPLRTKFHRCELILPPLRWLLNTPMEKCAYHTCCVPYMEVEYCEGFMASLEFMDEEEEEEDHEPEECEEFVLEHHHQRLPYFGDESAYREPVPATWRNLAPIRGHNPDWFPNYAHASRTRLEWEAQHFAACERLYTLEDDAELLHAAVQDLRGTGTLDMVKTAEAQVLEVEWKINQQRNWIYDSCDWALTPCPGLCKRTKTPRPATQSFPGYYPGLKEAGRFAGPVEGIYQQVHLLIRGIKYHFMHSVLGSL